MEVYAAGDFIGNIWQNHFNNQKKAHLEGLTDLFLRSEVKNKIWQDMYALDMFYIHAY